MHKLFNNVLSKEDVPRRRFSSTVECVFGMIQHLAHPGVCVRVCVCVLHFISVVSFSAQRIILPPVSSVYTTPTARQQADTGLHLLLTSRPRHAGQAARRVVETSVCGPGYTHCEAAGLHQQAMPGSI